MTNDFDPDRVDVALALSGIVNASKRPDWSIAEREGMGSSDTRELKASPLIASRVSAPPPPPAPSHPSLERKVGSDELEYLRAVYFGRGPVVA